MRKRVLFLVLSICIMFTFTGCGFLAKQDPNQEQDNKKTEEGTDMGEADATDDEDAEPVFIENKLSKGEYNLEEHIKLGKYKGIEVKVEKKEITEDDINLSIQFAMRDSGAELTEVSGRQVKKGDTVNIDFEGTKDGEPFEGGAAEGFEIIIGSGAFVPGFEDQLVGANIGDDLDLDITFPENYYEELAGQDVIFKVKVNGIKEYDLNEDYVKNFTDYDSVEEYRTTVKDMLNEELEKSMIEAKQNEVYLKILEGSEIISIPQSLYDYHDEDLRVYYANFAQIYGMDLTSLLMMSGMTEEDFDNEVKEYAETFSKRDLVVAAIIEAEDITLSDQEYEEEAEVQALEYGYDSAQEYIDVQGEERLRESFLIKKAFEFISAEAIEI